MSQVERDLVLALEWKERGEAKWGDPGFGKLVLGELALVSMVQGHVEGREKKRKDERGRRDKGACLPLETLSHGLLPVELPLPVMTDSSTGPTLLSPLAAK